MLAAIPNDMASDAIRTAGIASLLAAIMLTGCRRPDPYRPAKDLIAIHCTACHVVPGVPTARGTVGPSLAGIARRQIIAGRIANSRETMTDFLMHPRAIEPAGAMPELGLDERQATMIADYLQTLDKP